MKNKELYQLLKDKKQLKNISIDNKININNTFNPNKIIYNLDN